MKESMAGTWIFGIVALFIVLFSSFIAYSISYTKAFKVKNQILNYIEQNEGYTQSRVVDGIDLDSLSKDSDKLYNSKATDAKAFILIDNMGYNSTSVDCSNGEYGTEMKGGYCVKRVCYEESLSKVSNAKVVYKVTTFIKINLPVINLSLNLPIMGETKAIYYENDKVDTITELACFKSKED